MDKLINPIDLSTPNQAELVARIEKYAQIFENKIGYKPKRFLNLECPWEWSYESNIEHVKFCTCVLAMEMYPNKNEPKEDYNGQTK